MITSKSSNIRKPFGANEWSPAVFPCTKLEAILASALLLLISYAAVGANLFQERSPLQLISFCRDEPGPERLHSTDVLNLSKADVLGSWLPRWIYLKTRLLDGTLPLWNPYIAGGSPPFPSSSTPICLC